MPLSASFASALYSVSHLSPDHESGFIWTFYRAFSFVTSCRLLGHGPGAGAGAGSSTPAESAEEDPEASSKQRNNLLLFVCYLYVFNTLHHGLVFDLLEALVDRCTEV